VGFHRADAGQDRPHDAAVDQRGRLILANRGATRTAQLGQARRAVAALQTMTVSQVASTVLWETAGRGEDTMAVAALAAAVFERAGFVKVGGTEADLVMRKIVSG